MPVARVYSRARYHGGYSVGGFKVQGSRCVCVCVCVCESYYWISEMTRFCYPDKLSMDGMGFERQEINHSCCKSTSLRIIIIR